MLRASLIHAKSVGFNDACITAACRDLGYPSVTGGILKGGTIDVVDFAMDTWLSQMREDLSKKELS